VGVQAFLLITKSRERRIRGRPVVYQNFDQPQHRHYAVRVTYDSGTSSLPAQSVYLGFAALARPACSLRPRVLENLARRPQRTVPTQRHPQLNLSPFDDISRLLVFGSTDDLGVGSRHLSGVPLICERIEGVR
jgi:hypothetical protein